MCINCTEYVNVPVPVEVDSRAARRGNVFDVEDLGHSVSGTSNRTLNSPPATGTSHDAQLHSLLINPLMGKGNYRII